MSATNPTKPPKAFRVTAVQVPGEEPKPVATPTPATAAPAPATSALRPDDETLRARVQAINTPPETVSDTFAPSTKPEVDEVDLDAIRARIRDEERANARRELGQQIEAAASVAGMPAAAPRPKADYRTMRAADIDPATLTAPVMTLDGYLCPPAPEAKK